MSPKEKTNSPQRSPLSKRSSARLAAVQALYQMEIAGNGISNIFAEYETFWIGQEIDGVSFQPADINLFRKIIKGTVEKQKDIDPLINNSLTDNWPLNRIVPLLRAILRAGVYELIQQKDIAARIIISEYMNITQSFYDEDEPGLVNAVLDKIARNLRVGELESSKNK